MYKIKLIKNNRKLNLLVIKGVTIIVKTIMLKRVMCSVRKKNPVLLSVMLIAWTGRTALIGYSDVANNERLHLSNRGHDFVVHSVKLLQKKLNKHNTKIG